MTLDDLPCLFGTRRGEEYRAYDWEIYLWVDGLVQKGAIGRTDTRRRSRDRVNEALRDLPADVEAHGEIARTDVTHPGLRRLVEIAVRRDDGSITWRRI